MITITTYGAESANCQSIDKLDELKPILESNHTVWVQVQQPETPETIKQIADIFKIHELALEDVLTARQRPKVEQYGDIFFLVLHELSLNDEVASKQLCYFLGKNYVITFQNEPMQSLDHIRERLSSNQGAIRSQTADYLAYAILDAVVDTYFPVLEILGDRLEDLEDVILENPSREAITKIHEVKRSLLMVRRTSWPMRELINSLLRDSAHRFSDEVRLCLRDCYDHAVEIIELTETYRELGADLMDVYLSSISNRMNEVMKVLAIIATVFAPPTFVATIYGMNFNTTVSPYNMPELNWRYGYPFALLMMLLGSIAMCVFMMWKGWLGLSYPKRTEKDESSSH